MQYMPTALVDGCWLQGGVKVAIAHTPTGALLTGLYQHQVRAFVADPGPNFVPEYRATYRRLGGSLEELASQSFAECSDFAEVSLTLPIFLLGIAQFTRTYSFEILGLNLAWQFLNLSAVGPNLIQDAFAAHALPSPSALLAGPDYLDRGREMARDAVITLLGKVETAALGQAWGRLLTGINACMEIWTEWSEGSQASAPVGRPDLRQEMIDLLRRKASHALGYHGNRTLGALLIDQQLDPETFDGQALLDALARSPWVKPGRSDKSPFLTRLLAFGGPMLGVFSAGEQQIIRDWIDSLASPENEERNEPGQVSDRYIPGVEHCISGRSWKPGDFRQRSQRLYGNCTARELYYYLVNVEFYPDVLPMAERFAQERLERSMAMLWKGERPIPSRHYDPAALEGWLYQKHREQIDSYRPPDVRPEATKEGFIEATIQLAPLILIDGGWLQNVASPAMIDTPVGRMLFHVFVEELGEGKAQEHHANIYRDLLKAMREEPPPVETWEFAHWPRLRDQSFDVPALWLSISCFPRHFFPEILGLNLAVELAGVGGPYMEARDTLRRFRYPTLFVDVHNAADNVSAGHTAWALNAIKRYMDEVTERDGPHNVDRTWHRIWSGVRATLPQINRFRLLAYRFSRRFMGDDASLVPPIFLS
jgi:hypothetical protein